MATSGLFRGSASAFIVQVGGAVIGFGAHIIVARLLGEDEYGVYALVLTWIAILSVVSMLGWDTGVVRFLAVYIDQQNWPKARGLLVSATLLTFLASLTLSAGGIALMLLFDLGMTVVMKRAVIAGFLILPFVAQLLLNGAMHRGLKRPVSASIYSSVIRPVVFVALMLAAGVYTSRKIGAPESLIYSGIGALVALVLSFWFLVRSWPVSLRGASSEYEFRTWSRVGWHLFLIAAINIALIRLDVILLGALGGSADVGPYYGAVQIAAIVLFGINAVNTILAPMLAQTFASGDHMALAKLVRQAAWLTFILTVLLSLAIVIFGHWILSLFGPGFTVAYIPLLVILFGQCVNAAAGPVGFLMTMTKFEKQAPVFFGASAILNLMLSFALIPMLGMLGAAIANAAATIAWNITAYVFIVKNLSINPSVLPLRKI